MNIKHLHLLSLLFFCLPALVFSQSSSGVNLQVRVKLQGALFGVPGSSNLMRDNLRTSGYLPGVDPYFSLPGFQHDNAEEGISVILTHTLLDVEGPDAIVDWVFVEIRDAKKPATVVASRAGLLQRDGDVVGMNGELGLNFPSLSDGKYYIAVRHRNHLGVMTASAQHLGTKADLLDFTSPDFATFGTHAQAKIDGQMAMWAGDVNRDGRVAYQGEDSDRDLLFSDVLHDNQNEESNVNHIIKGYSNTDVNLDGKTIYQGPKEDKGYLLFELYHYWQNYCLDPASQCPLVAQLP